MGLKMELASFYAEVGRLIRKHRRKKKITQEDLALRVSLTRTSITNIERGRQRLPLHTLVEIANKLSVDVASLLPAPSQDEGVLDRVLKEHPEPEREWIKSAVHFATQQESN